MPVIPTFPGVYVEEIPSGVRTISGVSTSVTAFVGYTARGLDNRATRIFSFADFERACGGLDRESELSYAVQQFFANGGSEAYVVRVPKHNSRAASIDLPDSATPGATALTVTALSRGGWANSVIVDVNYDGILATDDQAFNLVITDLATGAVETFANVTMDTATSNYVVARVNDEDNGSVLVSVAASGANAGRPLESGTVGKDIPTESPQGLAPDTSYSISVTSDLPADAIANVEVTVLEPGEQVPGSILGLCRLLESRTNLALQRVLPGATIRCAPGGSGRSIRVNAFFSPSLIPGALHATITFGAGAVAVGKGDADAFLKLVGGQSNVAHYWLGIGTIDPELGTAGEDGTTLPTTGDLIGSESAFTGIYALDKVDLFNLLAIPDATRALPSDPHQLDADNVEPNSIFSAAMAYCKKRRAFLIVDPPPDVDDVASAVDWITSGLTVHDVNGAAYFPRLKLRDPLNDFQMRVFAPCGAVAGLCSRIDVTRGVWKAPAGTEATLTGVQGLVYALTDAENGALNPLGLNCFRTFPVFGTVAWGARTLVGADAAASEWKYVPVRRLALFMEESLYRGLVWTIFEGNDERLWSQIRLNVGAFMNNLFRQGAFQGMTPREAYFVKCDKDTTTQNDINLGIVNVIVGFAPLKPAEFVIIKIQQMAGQIQT
jgi:phage tail sheath protein FI